MLENLDHFAELKRNLIDEQLAQQEKFDGKSQAERKTLIDSGIYLFPIKVFRKYYGFADYPELEIKTHYPLNLKFFRESQWVNLFLSSDEIIEAKILFADQKTLTLQLRSPDFPDELDESFGVMPKPDIRTIEVMKKALDLVPVWMNDFRKLPPTDFRMEWVENENLNASQNQSLKEIFYAKNKIEVIHGPPGTGKSTTIAALVESAVKNGEKIAVVAPTHAAIDHLARKWIDKLSFIRLGSETKISTDILAFTPLGKWSNATEGKTLKIWKKQAEEYRRLAGQYKRNFGKAEREQRKLIQSELKKLRKDIKYFKAEVEKKWIDKASVICATPIGLNDLQLEYAYFDRLIIDEASQLLEPLFWAICPLAKQVIIVGDPFQLPPVLISEKAEKGALGISAIDRAFHSITNNHLLNLQYRMPPELIAFSNQQFYSNKLLSYKTSQPDSLIFYDTAGTGIEETKSANQLSICNSGEVDFIKQYLSNAHLSIKTITIITPYQAQKELLISALPNIKASTIDSFQGQEDEIIILSLVRSNEQGNLGFLKDYRRMNVAMTRAKSKLIVFGDSSLMGKDTFYNDFLIAVDNQGAYKSCWELIN